MKDWQGGADGLSVCICCLDASDVVDKLARSSLGPLFEPLEQNDRFKGLQYVLSASVTGLASS